MFADINRCKYFAARVMKQPANPQTKQKYTAICRPVEVDLSNPKVRIYRWKDIEMIDRGSGSYQDVVAPKKTGLSSLLDKANLIWFKNFDLTDEI